MTSKAHLALILGAALFASAGLAAAGGGTLPRSIWGADNPGHGASHAAMPEAGAEHNHAGQNHTDNRGGDGDNETADNETSDNETDDGDSNGSPPSDDNGAGDDDNGTADNDTDENGAPAGAGMPETLPSQANSHAQDNYPPATGKPAAS